MTDFDDVSYPGYPYRQTHPDRLALLARLHGLEPAAPDDCRVLELGCGDGLNVVGMAAGVPGLRGLGLDRAAGPLARGQAAIDALGIGDRVRLEAVDIRAASGLGTFDYVVAHGLYTWTPADVRDAALALCRKVLAPHGVAFVSFVAHPGGHLRTMAREIGLLASRGVAAGVGEQAERATRLYATLAPLLAGRADAYARAATEELVRMAPRPLSALVHDDLAETYEAFWLVDVVDHAARHGLRRLCEADPDELRDDWLPPELAELAGGDPLLAEQLADVLVGRAYRESVFCRADVPVSALTAAGLLAGDERRPVTDPDADLRAFRMGELELHAAGARWAATPGERPEAFALARLQAAAGEGVTTLRHEHVRLSHPVARRLVTLLDGTRDRAALAEALGEGHPPEIAAGLAHGLDTSLQRLADRALLVR